MPSSRQATGGSSAPIEAKTAELRSCIESRATLTDEQLLSSPECRELDLDVCLTARKAFTVFADYAEPNELQNQDVKQAVQELRDALHDALAILKTGKYDDVCQFQKSVAEKHDMVEGVLGGASLATLLDDLLCV